MNDTPLDRLFGKLVAAWPEMDRDERRLSIEIYRAMSLGSPVRVAELADRTGLAPERIERFLAR